MLFFQILLLGGYAYAHFSNKWLGPEKQRYVQIAILGAAAITLPFSSSTSFFDQIRKLAPQSPDPAFLVIGALAGIVGIAFFATSSNSPTLQRWFATTDDPQASNPYFLYAASNFGSMAGLVAYPFFFEPRFGLQAQSNLWRWAFYALVILFLIASIFIKPARKDDESSTESAVDEPVTAKQRLNWVALSAVPSSLLLGCTTYLTSNVAPVPLLWVAPLALYLITFMLAFATKPLLKAATLGRILPLIATPLIFPMVIEATEPLVPLALLHLATMFVGCWLCHSRLSENRPGVSHITEFYLWLSVGGVVGGVFNSIIAPLIFKTYLEYPLAIVLLLMVRPNFGKRTIADSEKWIRAAIPAVALLVLWAILRGIGMPPSTLRNGIIIGVPLVASFLSVDFSLSFALSIASILVLCSLLQVGAQGQVLATYRSFFGVHRVMKEANFITLVHGTTTHGRQSRDPAKRRLPLTYYHPSGPLGQVFTSDNYMEGVHDIGLVGLGVGSLAAYGRPGQNMTYFEIDPEVLKIARDSGDFTFIKDSQANMKFVLGDARLTLAQAPDSSYDLLVLDAFSSDAIPTHLLTLESLQIFKSKLKPGGMIAYHVSNRYLELAPVLAATALRAGLTAYEQLDGTTDDETKEGKTQSNWVLLTTDDRPIRKLGKPAYWNLVDVPTSQKIWTDDYSNVLGAMKGPND